MGRAKADMMRLEALENQAIGPLLKSGAVTECPIHEGIFMDQMDPDAASKAYAIGTNMVKAGEVDGSREEFMDAIKSALDHASDGCPICQRNAEKD